MKRVQHKKSATWNQQRRSQDPRERPRWRAVQHYLMALLKALHVTYLWEFWLHLWKQYKRKKIQHEKKATGEEWKMKTLQPVKVQLEIVQYIKKCNTKKSEKITTQKSAT